MTGPALPPPPRRWRAPGARRLAALALALLPAGASPGCSVDSDGRGPATAAQFVTQYESTLCDLVAACCDSRALPLDRGACRGSARATLPEALFDEAKYDYDPGSAAACLRALASPLSPCAPFGEGSFGPGSDFERACGRVFRPRGSAGPGELCAGTWQCAAPAEPDALATCTINDRAGGYGRTCEVIAYGGEAGPCDTGAAPRPDARPGVTRACQAGLYCAGDGTCQAPSPGAGQPCERGAEGACGGGTFCNGQSACEAPRAPGSPCDDAPDACDGAGYCDLASKSCLPRRAAGAPCARQAECEGACAGGVCSAPLPDRRDDYGALCTSPFAP
ncbi:MAG TPA: hypothetical protein VFS43_17105 [Polyangiaceae bacterium]|nr:hypothetical protein [Polyangiaceae bacterium]